MSAANWQHIAYRALPTTCMRFVQSCLTPCSCPGGAAQPFVCSPGTTYPPSQASCYCSTGQYWSGTSCIRTTPRCFVHCCLNSLPNGHVVVDDFFCGFGVLVLRCWILRRRA